MERGTDHIVIQGRRQGKGSRLSSCIMTSICCKIMEHILHSNIIRHLEENNILSENQHGFRKHRSCEYQLAITLQELADGLNKGDQTYIVTFLEGI